MKVPPILVAVIVLMAVAAAVMAYDGLSDRGDSERTDDGTFFRMPYSENEARGTVEASYPSEGVIAFSVDPALGFGFDGWYDADNVLKSTDSEIEFEIGEIEPWKARFVEVSGIVHVTVDWTMPLFSGDSPEVTGSEEAVFETDIDSDTWRLQMGSGIVRAPTENSRLPYGMVVADGVVTDIADYLDGLTDGMTDVQRAIVLMWFVQDAVSYEDDADLNSAFGTGEVFWNTPMETVFAGKGDCADTAVLFLAVGSVMGLETGFVHFPDGGHLAVAVAVPEDSGLDGNGLFRIDGQVYAYAETTGTAGSSDLGSIPAYGKSQDHGHVFTTITNGTWTVFQYDGQSGSFSALAEVAITEALVSENYGVIYGTVYGDAADGVVRLQTGDVLVYAPVKTFPARIVAYGDGIVDAQAGRGFLKWDPEAAVLTGTADRPGTYTVMLEANWLEGGVSHTARQVLTFVVTEPAQGYGDGGDVVHLDGDLAFDVTTEPLGDGGDDHMLLYVAAGIAAIVLAGVIVRFVL